MSPYAPFPSLFGLYLCYIQGAVEIARRRPRGGRGRVSKRGRESGNEVSRVWNGSPYFLVPLPFLSLSFSLSFIFCFFFLSGVERTWNWNSIEWVQLRVQEASFSREKRWKLYYWVISWSNWLLVWQESGVDDV